MVLKLNVVLKNMVKLKKVVVFKYRPKKNIVILKVIDNHIQNLLLKIIYRAIWKVIGNMAKVNKDDK